MCDTLPPCAVCGATPYCGLTPNCDPLIPPEPVISDLTFNVDIDPAELGPQFEQSFARDLGRALEVPADSIIVLSISGGSITVRFAIVPEANFNSTGTGGYSYDPSDKLAALQAMVQDPNSVLFTQSDGVFSDMPLAPIIPLDITDALDSSGATPAFPCSLPRHAPALRRVHISLRTQHPHVLCLQLAILMCSLQPCATCTTSECKSATARSLGKDCARTATACTL